ncbi:hypothetical protein R2A130_1140 [Ahrensia sp. R2A130]|nr:hypothetical protein R2A130_1140 [Ahrensia sp. R2A130]
MLPTIGRKSPSSILTVSRWGIIGANKTRTGLFSAEFGNPSFDKQT